MSEPVNLVSSLDEIPDRLPTFLAIGVFDGVHRGHQKLLRGMVAAAQAEDARPTVMTFFPHPGAVIRGRTGRLYLSPLEERVALLTGLGVELVIVHPFDDRVRHTGAADFVEGLYRHLDLRQIWGGAFTLGYKREGDLPFLQALGREKGFTVKQIAEMDSWGGRPVSSSRVRHALQGGDIEEVSGCLGRPYQLRGRVVRGDGRGRQIGVPTANIEIWDQLILPARGVYATFAQAGERQVQAATNIGHRPTVNGEGLTVEAHLLDFDGDLYGQTLTLTFVRRLRQEMKFDGLDSLVAQIQADIAQTHQILSSSWQEDG
jgi:riboflavin kinase/FMN adenylyltransferase